MGRGGAGAGGWPLALCEPLPLFSCVLLLGGLDQSWTRLGVYLATVAGWAGVSPWRRITAPIAAGSGGPPAARTSASSWK